MKTSEQIDKIAEALAKAQGMMRNPEKNRTATIPTKSGGQYSYDYADLPATFDAARKPLSENGISHTFATVMTPEGTVCQCRIVHSSGQWYESELPLPQSGDVKLLAANLTYLRRYLFSALTGLAGEDDTDAEPETDAKYTPKHRAPHSDKTRVNAPQSKSESASGVTSKAAPIEQPSAEDFVPAVGKLAGKPLKMRSTEELTDYMSQYAAAVQKSGKPVTEQSKEIQEIGFALEQVLAARGAK